MPELNLPTPGQSPNWANQLNTEIRKINTAVDAVSLRGPDWIDVTKYGVVADGVADDTTTLQALINDAPSGATLWAPVGSTLRTNGWVVNDKSISFDFSNSRIIKTSPSPVLYAEGVWKSIRSVTSLTGNETQYTATVSSTSGYTVGDVVKIYSDDVIPDARNRASGMPSGLYRQGEFGVVQSVSGSDITVTPGTIDTYSQNVRIARMSDARVAFEFKEIVAEGEGNSGAAFSGRFLFHFKGLRFPRLKGHVINTPGIVVDFQSCFQSYADITLDKSSGADGYGVDSRGSAFGEYHIVQMGGRHAFTDNPSNVTQIGATDPSDYGRSMYETIYGRSMGVIESHWDTHHGGYGHKFIGITATGSTGNGAPGFNLRGRGHMLIGCSARGFSRGFRILQEETGDWATSHSHTFVNCEASETYTAIEMDLPNAPADRFTLTIVGGSYESKGGVCLYARRSRIKFDNPAFLISGGSTTGTKFNIGSSIIHGSTDIYLRASLAMDNVFVLAPYSSDPRTKLDLDVNWHTPSATGGGFSNFARINDADVNLRVKSSRPLPISILTAGALGPERQQYTLRAMESSQDGTSSAQQRIAVATGTEIGPNYSGDPSVLVLVSSTGNVTAGGLQRGTHAGQTLVISNNVSSGSGVITIPDGGNGRLGGAKTLAYGQSLRLMWNTAGSGDVWIPV